MQREVVLDPNLPVATIGKETVITLGRLDRRLNKAFANGTRETIDPLLVENVLDILIRETLLGTLSTSSGTGEEIFAQNSCSDLKISDADVLAFYERHPKNFRRPDMTRAYQFLFRANANQSKVEAEALLKSLRKNADAPMKIVEQYKYSAKPFHGSLGYVDKQILPDPIEELLYSRDGAKPPRFAMAKTSLGHHVLMTGNHWPGRVYAFDEVKEHIRLRLQESECKKRMDEYLKQQYKEQVTILSENLPDSYRKEKFDRPKTDPPGMIYQSGGRFTLGSTNAEIVARVDACNLVVGKALDITCTWEMFADEKLERVFVFPFWIDEKEVTIGQFVEFAQQTGWPVPVQIGAIKSLPKNLPMHWTNFFDAQAYCDSKNKSVPSFKQWQFGARGVERRKFAWGNDPLNGTRGNFCDKNCDRPWKNMAFDDGNAELAPVGSYPAGKTQEGVYDMGGNVREWTQTDNGEGYFLVPGGSWWNAWDDMWAADVRVLSPWVRMDNMGFRCVKGAS